MSGIATLGTLTAGLAPNAVKLALGVVIAGTNTGIASPPLAHAVANTVQHHIRNRTQTIINAGTGVGVAVAVPIALLTLDHWRAAWLAFALVCAGATMWVARSVPRQPAQGTTPGVLRNLIPKPLFPQGSGLLIISAGMVGLASTAIWTFGRDLLTTVGGLSDTASAVAWVFLGAVGTLGAAAGDVGHRFGLRKSWRLAMRLMALGTALFAVFPHSSGIAWFGAAAFGLTYIGLTSLLLIWGTNVHPYSPASGVGIAFLVIALGQAVGSPLMGMIAGVFDLRVAFLFAAGVAVIGAFIKPVSARRSKTRTDVPTQVRDIA